MRSVLILFGPLVLWLASFSAVYGLQAIACAQGWTRGPVQMAWVAAIALQAALLLVLFKVDVAPGQTLERRASISLGIIGLIAVIWTMFPAVVLRMCS